MMSWPSYRNFTPHRRGVRIRSTSRAFTATSRTSSSGVGRLQDFTSEQALLSGEFP